MENSQSVAAEMNKFILNFSLDGSVHGNQGYNRVLLQLIGLVGFGKSTLINSCKYILEGGEYMMHANDEATNVRNAYQLTPNITIVDNRGFAGMEYDNIATVYAQLGTFLAVDEPAERITEYDAMIEIIEETDMDPNYTDLIVPVFVYSGTCPFREDTTDMSSFLRGCRTMTGVSPIIIITHKIGPYAAKAEKEFRMMGAKHVILVENYTIEDQMKTPGRDADILRFLYTALQDVIYRMQQRRNAMKERIERKKFLIKYMHKMVVTKEIDNMKRFWISTR